MTTQTGLTAIELPTEPHRRTGEDRRDARDRRRLGLHEIRARREGLAADRRRADRRQPRSWSAFLAPAPGHGYRRLSVNAETWEVLLISRSGLLW